MNLRIVYILFVCKSHYSNVKLATDNRIKRFAYLDIYIYIQKMCKTIVIISKHSL